MKCPKCQGATQVAETGSRIKEVERLRHCKVCEYRFLTMEEFYADRRYIVR